MISPYLTTPLRSLAEYDAEQEQSMTDIHTPTMRYEAATKTLRSVPENYWIASMDSWDGAVNHKANAAYIVKACNSHEQLVAALELWQAALLTMNHALSSEQKAACKATRAALAAAK